MTQLRIKSVRFLVVRSSYPITVPVLTAPAGAILYSTRTLGIKIQGGGDQPTAVGMGMPLHTIAGWVPRANRRSQSLVSRETTVSLHVVLRQRITFVRDRRNLMPHIHASQVSVWIHPRMPCGDREACRGAPVRSVTPFPYSHPKGQLSAPMAKGRKPEIMGEVLVSRANHSIW